MRICDGDLPFGTVNCRTVLTSLNILSPRPQDNDFPEILEDNAAIHAHFGVATSCRNEVLHSLPMLWVLVQIPPSLAVWLARIQATGHQEGKGKMGKAQVSSRRQMLGGQRANDLPLFHFDTFLIHCSSMFSSMQTFSTHSQMEQT